MNAHQANLVVGGQRASGSTKRSNQTNSTLTIGTPHPRLGARLTARSPVSNTFAAHLNDVQSAAAVTGISSAPNTVHSRESREAVAPVKTISADPFMVTLWFHEMQSSHSDFIISRSTFPTGVTSGQVYGISLPETADSASTLVYFSITPSVFKDKTDNDDFQDDHNDDAEAPPVDSQHPATTQKPRYQLSLLANPLRHILDVAPRSVVSVALVPDTSNITADSIEIFVKDVNTARDTMWAFSSSLVNTCVYAGQRLTFLGSRSGVVRYIYRKGEPITSAYIGADTNIVYRSESARLMVLIQLSREMWNFQETGEIMFHKLVNSLLPEIFKRWRQRDTHHSITITLFASVDITDILWLSLKGGERPESRNDYFRVVVDQVSIQLWETIMANLRLEFANFKRDVLVRRVKGSEQSRLDGELLPSVKGNILEALNLSLVNGYDTTKNLDLKHSINHYIVITPGTGLFDVDYDLMIETSRKMAVLDAGLDIVCLSQPPLHVVPLMRYLDPLDKSVRHCVPNWCDISFYGLQSTSKSHWIPHCKMYELQMMGIVDNELKDVSVKRYSKPSHSKSMIEAMAIYDDDLFKTANQFDDSAQSSGSASSSPRPISPASLTATSLANNNASLSLISRASILPFSTVAASKSSVVPATPSVMGTVTNTPNDVSALSALYQLNKAGDDKKLQNSSRGVSRSTSLRGTPLIKAEIQPKQLPASQGVKTIQVEDFNATGLLKSTQLAIPVLNLAGSKSSQRTFRRGKAVKPEVEDVATKHELCDRYFTRVDNPSRQLDTRQLTSNYFNRWRGVFPRFARLKLVKWRSFLAPAGLPNITDVFPLPHELDTQYTFRTYTVMLNFDNYIGFKSNFALLVAMMQLRLVAGFQICCGINVRNVEQDRQNDGNLAGLIKHFPTVETLGTVAYMSSDREIHRLFYDYNGNVMVQSYRRSLDLFPKVSHLRSKPYHPLIRTRYADEYLPAQVDPLVLEPKSYNWNRIDQILSGFEEDIQDALMEFHMMKFVVVPAEISQNTYTVSNENLSNEEIRMEGLRKLTAMIEKGKASNLKSGSLKSAPRGPVSSPEIVFYTGNLFEFLERGAETYNIHGSGPNRSPVIKNLMKSIDLAQLAVEMQGANGLHLVDRIWHFKRHLNCFVGSELVLWLVESFGDISSREEATQYAQGLMDQSLFKHVTGRHGFLDGYYFYAFENGRIEKSENGETTAAWFKTTKSGHSKRETENQPDGLSALVTDVRANPQRAGNEKQSPLSSPLDGPAKCGKIILSTAVKYDVDPTKKSYRPEIVTIHYDRVHNPDHCYHIRLQWLNTTAKLIDDTIINFSRVCERYGLKLIETPWKELCKIPETSPFHLFVDLRLDVDPWKTPEFAIPEILGVSKFYYHSFFLKKCGFMLDNRLTSFFLKSSIEIGYSWGEPTFKYAQYIHRTGLYYVELREDGGFFLAPNNIHLARPHSTMSTSKGEFDQNKRKVINSQRVMLAFRRACQNASLLFEIFNEAKLAWKSVTTECELAPVEDV